MILITSSFCVVKAVEFYDLKVKHKTLKYLYLSLALGVTFLVLKFFEYGEKVSNNFVLGANEFFDYYWILTAFHAIHIIVGLGVLLGLIYHVAKDKPFAEEDFSFHTGANYWHLCDLIWIIIFPTLYLL